MLTVVVIAGCASPVAGGDGTSFEDYTDELFAAAGLTWETWEEARIDAERVREEEIARCMKSRGFDYRPKDSRSGDVLRGAEFDRSITEGSREFAEIYGYGHTPVPGTRVPPGFVSSTYDDPNADMIAAMSEAGRKAYVISLYGDDAETVESDSCVGMANELPAVKNPSTDETWVGLRDDYEAGLDGATVTPEVGAATAVWRECMAGAGYDLVQPSDVHAYVARHVRDAWLDATLIEVREDHRVEVDVAVADWDCQEASGYRAAYERAVAAYDADFMARHEAELNGLLLTYSTGSAAP